MKMLTVLALLLSTTTAFASSLPKNTQRKACESRAIKAAGLLYTLNTGENEEGAQARLLGEEMSESGKVLTWEIAFPASGSGQLSAPYQLLIIEEGCFVFDFSIPAEG